MEVGIMDNRFGRDRLKPMMQALGLVYVLLLHSDILYSSSSISIVIHMDIPFFLFLLTICKAD